MKFQIIIKWQKLIIYYKYGIFNYQNENKYIWLDWNTYLSVKAGY